MATLAHCAYCFESLAASLEKRPSLSLEQVEELWEKYSKEPTSTSEVNEASREDAASANDPGAAYKSATISRLLAPSPRSASSSSLQSASSTPSGISSASSATSPNSSRSNLFSPSSGHGKRQPEEEHPLFVTWNTRSRHGDKRLRGCIGTFEAQPLHAGLRSYALTSALDDTRFSPITARELSSLEVAVTLLTDFEPVADKYDWEVGVHGLRISFVEGKKKFGATYLPDVAREQEWDKDETLASLMRKAGYNGRGSEWKEVDIKVVRYQGNKVALSYGEWKAWRDWVDEGMVQGR